MLYCCKHAHTHTAFNLHKFLMTNKNWKHLWIGFMLCAEVKTWVTNRVRLKYFMMPCRPYVVTKSCWFSHFICIWLFKILIAACKTLHKPSQNVTYARSPCGKTQAMHPAWLCFCFRAFISNSYILRLEKHKRFFSIGSTGLLMKNLQQSESVHWWGLVTPSWSVTSSSCSYSQTQHDLRM